MISVVIPLYNKEESIAHSLWSVLTQSRDDFEVVIVDDGSTDSSVSIVESISDSRIRLIRQKNGGPSNARNTGARNSRGEWILFLDADDELLPGALECFYYNIENIPSADMFLGEMLISDGKSKKKCVQYKNEFIKNPFRTHVFGRLIQCSGTTVYRKEICLKIPFNENIRRYEDLQRIFTLYRMYKLYTIHKPVSQMNSEFAEASHPRKNIEEDFLGYLNFQGKSFWEKMALYSLYLGERDYYPEACQKLYPWLYRRYDWFLIYKIISMFKSLLLNSK